MRFQTTQQIQQILGFGSLNEIQIGYGSRPFNGIVEYKRFRITQQNLKHDTIPDYYLW